MIIINSPFFLQWLRGENAALQYHQEARSQTADASTFGTCLMYISGTSDLETNRVERLSSSVRLKLTCCYGKGVQKCVFCWEVVSFSEGPFIGGYTALLHCPIPL